jgi:alpha-tubulin suppressor-like RCC1 family protein
MLLQNQKWRNAMSRMTRPLQVILLAVLTALFITACGSNHSDSSAVLWGHSAVRSSDGTLRTWGANGFGQLGNNSTNDSHSPVVLGNYSSASIGGGHTVALNTNGTVSDWGYNSNGQLGNNSTTNSSTPVLVSGLTGIKEVAAGSRHTLALASSGTVYAWGYNGYGQLGNGGTNDIYTPYTISNFPSGTSITKIAGGGFFSLALDTNGNVWAWGDNTYGELGNTPPATGVPVKVQFSGVSVTPFITDIAAGGSHALAIDSSGNVWAWGYNYYGQLGNGTANNQSTAVKVWDAATRGIATAVSAGLDHSLLIANGIVYSCGHNYNGQLGNGGDLLKDTPFTSFQAISGTLPNIASVIAAGNQSIAIDVNGNVWTWGQNAYGQLGDGTTTDRSTALKIY